MSLFLLNVVLKFIGKIGIRVPLSLLMKPYEISFEIMFQVKKIRVTIVSLHGRMTISKNVKIKI